MNNKSILNFKTELEQELLTNYKNLDFEILEIPKSNEIKLGIVFKTDDLSPVFYLDDLYKEYKKNSNIKLVIMNMLMEFYSMPIKTDLPLEITDFNVVKNFIFPVLVNTGKNKNLLLKTPNKQFSNDIRYIFKIIFYKKDKTSLEVRITYELLEKWGMSIDDIESLALSNLYKSKYKIKKVDDVVFEMLTGKVIDTFNPEHLENNILYVISNETNMNGSVHILNINLMEYLKNGFKRDFIILPSSLHEILVVSPPTMNQRTIFNLIHTVQEVNNTQVENCDFLSDYPLAYSIEKNKLLDIKEYLEINNMI